jgi:hypothetical protein
VEIPVTKAHIDKVMADIRHDPPAKLGKLKHWQPIKPKAKRVKR